MKEVKEVVDTVSVALANGQPEEAGNVVMQEVNHALLSMGVDEACLLYTSDAADE